MKDRREGRYDRKTHERGKKGSSRRKIRKGRKIIWFMVVQRRGFGQRGLRN